MAEATHTAEAVYGLRKAVGKGHRIWAAYLQIDDGETVDTGLDTIEAAVFQPIGDVCNTWHLASPASVATTGTITMSVGKIPTDYADAAGHTFYAIVIGTSRGL